MNNERSVQLNLYRSTLKPNSTIPKPLSFLVIVESKLTLDKTQIDRKIQKITEIKNTINNAKYKNYANSSNEKTSFNSFNDKFKKYVDDYEINNYPDEIYIIFCAENISNELKDYIKLIKDNITLQTYNSILMKILESDRTYKEFDLLFEKIKFKPKHKKNDYSSLKQKLEYVKSDESRTQNGDKFNKFIGYLEKINKEHSELEEHFSDIKGHIGYICKDDIMIANLVL